MDIEVRNFTAPDGYEIDEEQTSLSEGKLVFKRKVLSEYTKKCINTIKDSNDILLCKEQNLVTFDLKDGCKIVNIPSNVIEHFIAVIKLYAIYAADNTIDKYNINAENVYKFRNRTFLKVTTTGTYINYLSDVEKDIKSGLRDVPFLVFCNEDSARIFFKNNKDLFKKLSTNNIAFG